MNSGRRTAQPKSNKPVSINIYYNINSKNITNSHNQHQTQTAPVSARISDLNHQHPIHKEVTVGGQKTKAKSTRLKKKKYSMDLTSFNDKKLQIKNNRRSYNNSVCSGNNPPQRKKVNEKGEKGHKDNLNDQKERKIAKLLENYSAGSIDQKEIAKKILNIFQNAEKNPNLQDKKICKKKKSESTLIGTATPRNLQIYKNTTVNNSQGRYLSKTRKKHTKSEKSSYHPKSMTKENDLGAKLIEIKGIDSSLFLSDREDDKNVIIERIEEIHTSNSVVDLHKLMAQERRSLPVISRPANPYRQMMATKIQRAWRRYKTKCLIKQLITTYKNHLYFESKVNEKQRDNSSLIGQLDEMSVSEKIGNKNEDSVRSLSSDFQQLSNFLSQQMPQIKNLKCSQKMKGGILRNHELSKWNQIMEYVQLNINNKQINPADCLHNIIEYFENVKTTVEQELTIGGVSTRVQNKSTDDDSNKKKLKNDKKLLKKQDPDKNQEQDKIESHSKAYNNGMLTSRQSPQIITEFTNKISYRDPSSEQRGIISEDQSEGAQSDIELVPYNQVGQNIKINQQVFEEIKMEESEEFEGISLEDGNEDLFKDELSIEENLNELPIPKLNHELNYERLEQALTPIPSLDKIQQSLLKHYNRIQKQHQQQLEGLDINSKTYFQTKKEINKKYQQMKQELKKIIKNFNKGYQKAKNILDQEINADKESGREKWVPSNLSDCASHGSLSKCKSDNYLLKTAINYKKYMEKKEKLKGDNESQSDQSKSFNKLMRHSDNTNVFKCYDIKKRVISHESNEKDERDSSEIIDEQVMKNIKIIKNGEKTDEFGFNNRNNSKKHQVQLSAELFNSNTSSKQISDNLNIETSKSIEVGQFQGFDNQSGLFEQSKINDHAVSSIELIPDITGKQPQLPQCEQPNFVFQENVMSAQLLQYQELNKNFDDEEQVSQELKVKKAEEISLFENNQLNKNIKKMRYLTSEDKEDIFQFLFIDLSLEIITEYDQNTKIYETLVKEIKRRKTLLTIPRGVKTSLNASKQYIMDVISYVRDKHWPVFLKNIGVAMGPTAREMLRYMHDEQYQNESEQQPKQQSVPLILPTFIFEENQAQLPVKYPRYYQDEEKQLSRIKFLKSVDHIHHKAIFDCLNQWLDIERPYGLWGAPFPWRTTTKRSKIQNIPLQTKQQKLNKVINQTIQCCSYLCGVLVDKEESVFGNHKVSQHYVEQIREDRMCKMISNQLYQTEDRWHFLDDEQTEVLVEISKMITKNLVEEAIMEINIKAL